MYVPVSTPARSLRNSNPKAASSCSVRSVSVTSAAAIRISVSSCRCRTGPVRRSANRPSRRRLNARSMGLDALGDGWAERLVGPMAAKYLDELLELHQPEDQPLGSRRAARHVDVDRHDPVDPLDRRVAPLVAPARARAVAHRDAPLGLRHLLPEPEQRS